MHPTSLRNSFLLLLVITLVGCSFSPFRSLHEAPPATPAEAVRHTLDEVNAGIAAAATTLADARTAGTVTWAEFDSTRASLNNVRDVRNTAEAFLSAGDITSAEGQLKLANALLGPISKKLAAIKNGGAK